MIKRTLIAAAVLALIPMTGMAQEVGHPFANHQASFQAFESSIADYDGDSGSIELGKNSYSGNEADVYAIGRDARGAWVVGDIAADNGLTVAVQVGKVVKDGSRRKTEMAMLDGIVFTDSRRLSPEVQIRIEHDCAAARTTVLDYAVAQYDSKAVFSKQQAAKQRKGAMAGRFVEQLSPVAEAEVHQVLCEVVAPERKQFSSLQEALAQSLGTDRANYPPIAVERARRIIHANALLIDQALDKVREGACPMQRHLPSEVAKRDIYLWKLTESAHLVSDRGLHAGPRASYGADWVMWEEVEAVQAARQCLGDTSPLPAQGVVIPKELMPIKDGE